MPGVEAGGEPQSLFKADLDKGRIVAGIFLAAIGQILIRRLASDDDVPILLLDNFLKFFWSFSGGVETADQAAHAGASDVVNRNVMVVEPLQNADVSEAQRAAAFERDADFGARTLRWRGL